jgi:hypothetical protein
MVRGVSRGRSDVTDDTWPFTASELAALSVARDRNAVTRRADGAGEVRSPLATPVVGQTGGVIGIVIFAVMAVVVVGAFAAQVSRRRRYEEGEYDPDDV